ncbi:hypothetical protein [Streptomyces albiflavescens]|uniref:hypothetical protein n=1 Tax=Streptomyces albiflavescens TaxID=1623582 RepID=UPI00166E0ABE|nr:hypothetical protein [Streptomyces albiflavescens]
MRAGHRWGRRYAACRPVATGRREGRPPACRQHIRLDLFLVGRTRPVGLPVPPAVGFRDRTVMAKLHQDHTAPHPARWSARRQGGWGDDSESPTGYFEVAGIRDETNPLYGIGVDRSSPSRAVSATASRSGGVMG